MNSSRQNRRRQPLTSDDDRVVRRLVGELVEQGHQGTVTLEAAGPVLARSRSVQALLAKKLNPQDLLAALNMLKSGLLEGDLGESVHDMLVDAIENDAKIVWEGVIPGSGFPVNVQSYGGVFCVWAMEYDKVGYFLLQSSAVDYIHGNWGGARGRVCR